MKRCGKFLIALCIALATLASCGEERLAPENGITESQSITFNLTADHSAATKAVKTGWESGDAIFVFFSGAAPDGTNVPYLKMTFNGTQWTSTEMNGSTVSPRSLGLNNGDTGTMRAVFLPFGSNLTVLKGETDSFKFNETQYAYYLTATLEYTVSDGKVSGVFQMKIPDGYVQFFVDDESAASGAYTLATDAVIPVGVASVTAAGNVVETTDKVAGDDLTGYAYGTGDHKGYLFSGKMVSPYHYDGYYFAKTKVADNTRCDYFVTGKTLNPNSAVKLPANNSVYGTSADGKWIPVGPDESVNLYFSSGTPSITWATCNHGASRPEETGVPRSFDDACAEGYDADNDTNSLPGKEVLNQLGNSQLKQTPITVHGKRGFVISANQGFLFLPVTSEGSLSCSYWSSTESDNEHAYYFFFTGNPDNNDDYMYQESKDQRLGVRMIRR